MVLTTEILIRGSTTKLCPPCVELYYNFQDEFFGGYSGNKISDVAI
jgi:hypothetical protein